MTAYQKRQGFMQTYTKWILIHIVSFCIPIFALALRQSEEYFKLNGHYSIGYLVSSLLVIRHAPIVVIVFSGFAAFVSGFIAFATWYEIRYESAHYPDEQKERAITCSLLSGFWFIVGMAVAIGNGWIR
jgi:hypothetical protein